LPRGVQDPDKWTTKRALVPLPEGVPAGYRGLLRHPLKRLCETDEALADTRRLTQEFAEMVRSLDAEDLEGWLKDAEESDSTAMRSFALGAFLGRISMRYGRASRRRSGATAAWRASSTSSSYSSARGVWASRIRVARREDVGSLVNEHSTIRRGRTICFTINATEPAFNAEVCRVSCAACCATNPA
jgi:hypothetical protein